MTRPLGEIGHDEFLRGYWQKEPLLIRGAFPGFVPELDADDIAGLACEELAESRLITGSFPENDWTLRHGPFTERTLRSLPGSDWTLLVQDVEKHYPPLRALVEEFRFLPRWRIDDLMVSVAAPGGSVGPHSDQYDVFLLQASGRRTWQIAREYDPGLQAGTELNVLASFQAEREWTLEPGDMLYLPPGVAHHGVAIDAGMTWSIGMRAPSSADLFLALGEWLADEHSEGERYSDPGTLEGGSRLDESAIARFEKLLRSATDDRGDFTQFLGGFLSRYRLAHEPAEPPEKVRPDDIRQRLLQGFALRQNPWTRMLWIDNGDGQATLFAAGTPFRCSKDLALFVCEPSGLESTSHAVLTDNLPLLAELVNAGHLYLETPE